jgi:hypothetical protein
VTDHVATDARRSQPAYRAAIWLLRLAFAITIVCVIAMATDAVPLVHGLLLAYVLIYLACILAASVLFARTGVRFGPSDEGKANGKIVWWDVFRRNR